MAEPTPPDADRPLPLIGVYYHRVHCMLDDVLKALTHFGYPLITLTKDNLRALEPGEVDVLLFPGGWYFFEDDVAGRVRGFVEAGGGYVGICCGQINAVKFGLLDAKLYSMFGIGPTTLEPVDGHHPVLEGVVKACPKEHREWERIDIVRYNGWPMVLGEGAHMIAAYDMDKELAAIACSEYGKGKVVAFSPHPEGATCKPGVFKDRDGWPMVYDGVEMGTAQMLDNALRWVAPEPPSDKPMSKEA